MDIRHTINMKPKVGVLSDGGTSAIHMSILADAGFVEGVLIGEGCRRVWPASTGGVLLQEEAMAEAPRDVTVEGEVLPLEKTTVAGKLKAAAAQVEAAEPPRQEAPQQEAPELALTAMGLHDYISQAADLAALEAFRDDVAALDARTVEGKAARRAYNTRLAALTADQADHEAA